MALHIRGATAGRVRHLVTPEGVPIPLTLATLADRFSAFLIDAILVVGMIVVLVVSTVWAGDWQTSKWTWALLDAAIFALMNGYFIWFEIRWAGRTPGKKTVGIRVVSRSGGPLRADAVIARNLMRTVEVILPLAVILSRDRILAVESDLTWMLATAWLLGLALLPAFNRDRLRAGDLVGGTWVVRAPRASLLRDLARRATAAPAREAAAPVSAAASPPPLHAFTSAQLDVYGIYELQALEEVLRSNKPESARLRAVVAEKIARKIGWTGALPEPGRFLADFYAAMRAHHERRLLFGQRKDRKSR